LLADPRALRRLVSVRRRPCHRRPSRQLRGVWRATASRQLPKQATGRIHCARPRVRPTLQPLLWPRRVSQAHQPTPPAVRFLGRHVYLAAVLVLASAMRHGVTALRAAKLTALLRVSRRTLGRWRRWWVQTFVAGEVLRPEGLSWNLRGATTSTVLRRCPGSRYGARPRTRRQWRCPRAVPRSCGASTRESPRPSRAPP